MSVKIDFALLSCLIVAFAVGCEPAGDTGLPPPPYAPPNDGGDPNDRYVPPTDGGRIAPPQLPSQSFATTAGGYVTLTKIDSYEVSGGPELLGATQNSQGTYVLMERSISYYVKMWDVYHMTSGSSPMRICSIPRPGSSSDRFNGFIYHDEIFRIHGESSGYPSWVRIYDFNISSCAIGTYKTIYSSVGYTGTPILSVFKNKYYHSYGSQLRVWDQDTGLISAWSYSSATISSVTPYPVQPSFSIGSSGNVWFMDVNRRLWRGIESGTWDGFAEFPYGTYSDLSYAKFTLPALDSIKIITYDKYGGSLIIYHLNTRHF